MRDQLLAIGIFVSMFVVILIIAVLMRRKEGDQFDERQLMLRSRAYQNAFFAIMLYSVLYGEVTYILERSFMEDGVATLIGAFLGLLVFAVECIWNDAFFNVKQKPQAYLLLCTVVVLSNGLNAFRHIKAGDIIRNGLLSGECFNLVIAVTFFVILLNIIAKLVCSGREEE